MDIIRYWIESTHCNIIIKVRIIILRSSKCEQFVCEVRTKKKSNKHKMAASSNKF